MRHLFILSLLCCLEMALALRLSGGTPEDHFRDDVWPVLENSCLRCHGPEKQKAGLRLDSKEAALRGSENGPVMVPGKPQESLLVKLVKHLDADHPMPPKDKLSDAEIAAMERWISEGAPWPEKLVVDDDSNKKLGDAWSDPKNPIVKIFGGKRLDLWSLKPIVSPPVPKVSEEKWVRNGIDSFVLAKIEESGAKPAAEADRRTLARRLYFDLTGLPPSPEQMEAFLADKSEGSYETLVDKLLESPAYGEHWARFWLDVARYADSNGFDWDEFRPKAWRYRDYVIRSLNADKPFDRFIQEQLAGDEMVPGAPRSQEEQDCLIATGFLRVGPYDNSASKFGEDLRCRTQVMSDLVETTGSAFLGMTMICSRCHNHKFDPISQKDYYRLRAMFEGVSDADWLPLNLAPEQAEIEAHNLKLIAMAAEKDRLCAEIAKPYIDRFRANRIAKLSEEDRALLSTAPLNPDHVTEHKLWLLRKRTEPRQDQVREFFTDEDAKRYDQLVAESQQLSEQSRHYLTAMVAHDESAVPPLTRLLFQGDFRQPREIIKPGFLSVLDPNPAVITAPARSESSGRRTALARWIASKSNPLTARVFVNRIWQAHFGTGIQATANDFGLSGSRPTDPALLDWLASNFVEQGWSLKKLHKLIVTSATYRQGMPAAGSAVHPPVQVMRMPKRLTAEQLRDSMLMVSGKLKACSGGEPVWPELPAEIIHSSPSLQDDLEFPLKGWHTSPPEASHVRSIYLVQKRSVRVPMMEAFDLPDTTLSCPRREVSTVAPQALALLNDPFAAEMSLAFAERLRTEVRADKGALIDRAFSLALQRLPDPDEKKASTQFLEKRSLAEFCRALLNLNEFCYVD